MLSVSAVWIRAIQRASRYHRSLRLMIGKVPFRARHSNTRSRAVEAPLVVTARLSDGNVDDVTFVGGDDVIKDFKIGEDALTIDVPGLQLADNDVSSGADFVAMIEAATLVELSVQANRSILEAYICEHSEGAADLVLVVRDAEGLAAHSVKLVGLASEIGVAALEDAGAIVERDNADTPGHDHCDGPMVSMDMADQNTSDHDGHDHVIPDVIEDITAFLMAMGEGSRIEIHAADASKESRTQLSQNAFAGD